MLNKLCVGLIKSVSNRIFRDETAHQLKIQNSKVTTYQTKQQKLF